MEQNQTTGSKNNIRCDGNDENNSLRTKVENFITTMAKLDKKYTR